MNTHFARIKSAHKLNCIVLAALACASFLAPANAQSSRPGMGSTPYSDALGSGVTYRVWAPDGTSVAVRGAFNTGGWNNTSNFLVSEGGGTGLWSKDVTTSTTGDEYKYYLNGSTYKNDPRARKMVNSAGNSIVYNPNAFSWGGDTRLSVNVSNLVIYEMHVGAFYDPSPSSGGPGKFTDAVTKLDYLVSLGVKAVELMPIAEFAGDYSWGYNPADIYAVENTGYGGPDGLKTFVKAAHQRGIRVLLDVVHNHYGPSDLDLWTFDTGASPSIYFYTAANICCTPWGGRPNYSTAGVRSFIIDSIRMWLDEYHIDGFRWDSVGAIRFYDPGHVEIADADSLLQYINGTTIHTDHPGAISIAEDQSGGMNFDGEWDVSFGDEVINEMSNSSDSGRDMNALKSAMDGSGFSRVLYSETHDLVGAANGTSNQRLPVRIQSSNPTSFFARKRSMLASAIVMTTPGIPMLFMGQEMLATNQFADSAPLDWTRVNTYSNVEAFYHDLIRLRCNMDGVSPGLTGPNITWHVTDNTAKVLAYHRWGASPNDQVMVVINCSNKPLTNYSVGGFPANGNWFVNLNSDWLAYGSDFENKGAGFVPVSGGTGLITLGRYSVQILSRQALTNLDSDGDGLLNGWEQANFGDPVSANPTDDSDGDGANNLQEQAAGTDPNNANSVLKFMSAQVAGGNLKLTWQGGQTAKQIIQQSTNLGATWSAIYTNLPPTAITNSISIPASAAGGRYFRIQIAP